MGTTSSNFELDEETKLTKLSSSADFKKLVVCGTRDKNVNEKLREHQIIETNVFCFMFLSSFVLVFRVFCSETWFPDQRQESRWTTNYTSPDYFGLVDKTINGFETACMGCDIKMKFPRVKKDIVNLMKDLDFELSTSGQEWLNALKGCLVFHFWEETITLPINVNTQSRNDFELSSTLHAAYFVKLDLNIQHTKTVQWYVTKKETWKCALTVDFKIVYLNVGIFENMTRMNSLQITKDDSRGSMSIVCRSFDENGEAIADEFSFSADETKEIEAEAESFTQTFLTETKLL